MSSLVELISFVGQDGMFLSAEMDLIISKVFWPILVGKVWSFLVRMRSFYSSVLANISLFVCRDSSEKDFYHCQLSRFTCGWYVDLTLVKMVTYFTAYDPLQSFWDDWSLFYHEILWIFIHSEYCYVSTNTTKMSFGLLDVIKHSQILWKHNFIPFECDLSIVHTLKRQYILR